MEWEGVGGFLIIIEWWAVLDKAAPRPSHRDSSMVYNAFSHSFQFD